MPGSPMLPPLCFGRWPQIESIRDIIPILEQVTRLNQPLLIIAEDVTGGWACCGFGKCVQSGRACTQCGGEGGAGG